MDAPGLGQLLVTVTGAMRRAWRPGRVWNLFVFERGLVAVQVRLIEVMEGPATVTGWAREQQNRRLVEGSQPLAELVHERPGTRVVSRAEVIGARLHWGVTDVRLVLELADGSVLRWVWTYGGGVRSKLGIPNASRAEIEAGIRGWLGGKLTVV